MSRYAVTKVRYTSGKLGSLLIHPITVTNSNQFAPAEGEEMAASEVANLIQGGDRVTVLVEDAEGNWNLGPDLGCKRGTDDLTTINFVGRAKVLLENLPTF